MLFLFDSQKSLKALKKNDFKNEKALQNFIESNLQELFGIRFVATEHTTSKNHGGRIDTLGLDEHGAPVIIEYKRGEKDNIINQGLFYLDWLVDHPGDFQVLVQQKLGVQTKVDFGSPRVVLIAQSFNKYDQHAIHRMSENIELWAYSRYEQNVFELKRVASSHAKTTYGTNKTQISRVEYNEYSVEQHLQGKDEHIRQLFNALQSRIFDLEADQPIEEVPLKHVIVYRTSKNFVAVVIQNKHIKLLIDVVFSEMDNPRQLGRDVSKIGRMSSGTTEVVYDSLDDLDYIMGLIEQSYVQSV